MSLALLSESQGAKRQRCGEHEDSTTRGFDLFSASSTPVQSGRSSPVHVHIPMPNQMITVGYFGAAIPDGGEVTTEQWEAFVGTHVAQRLGPPFTPQTRRRRTACWCKLQASKLTQTSLLSLDQALSRSLKRSGIGKAAASAHLSSQVLHTGVLVQAAWSGLAVVCFCASLHSVACPRAHPCASLIVREGSCLLHLLTLSKKYCSLSLPSSLPSSPVIHTRADDVSEDVAAIAKLYKTQFRQEAVLVNSVRTSPVLV